MKRLTRVLVSVTGLAFAASGAAGYAAATTSHDAGPATVDTWVRYERLVKEVGVRVSVERPHKKPIVTGASVHFNRRGAYGNPHLILEVFAPQSDDPEFEVFFDDRPGPVSTPVLRLVHQSCDSTRLC